MTHLFLFSMKNFKSEILHVMPKGAFDFTCSPDVDVLKVSETRAQTASLLSVD